MSNDEWQWLAIGALFVLLLADIYLTGLALDVMMNRLNQPPTAPGRGWPYKETK